MTTAKKNNGKPLTKFSASELEEKDRRLAVVHRERFDLIRAIDSLEQSIRDANPSEFATLDDMNEQLKELTTEMKELAIDLVDNGRSVESIGSSYDMNRLTVRKDLDFDYEAIDKSHLEWVRNLFKESVNAALVRGELKVGPFREALEALDPDKVNYIVKKFATPSYSVREIKRTKEECARLAKELEEQGKA
ncbi:MAG: hypothetical protein IJV90_06920 [Candidatus Methanomethylophilaceae archaeon]|nr:hypothetical protein [Candidatus Methanomethylophilaceae archaeon]